MAKVPLFDEAAVLQLTVDQQRQMSISSLYTSPLCVRLWWSQQHIHYATWNQFLTGPCHAKSASI